MNDPDARRRLPDGLAKDFLSGMVNGNVVPQRRWSFVRLFRRIAAMVAARLFFAGLSYATVVGIGMLGDIRIFLSIYRRCNHEQNQNGGGRAFSGNFVDGERRFSG